MKNILPRFKILRIAISSLIVLFGFTGAMPDLHAQNQVITGTVVSEDGEALPGVAIRVQNTTIGTVTDVDGKFSIEVVEKDAALVFSYVGFKPQIILISGRTSFNIVLEEDITQLSEVVVIGYGTQKKSHLTGAISKLTNENLEQLPFARVDDALVGQVSGVQISSTSEEGVGSDPTILVRGVGSITGGSGPLLVIDGAPVDSEFFGNIDMNDIESFEILKDAASAAIFGSRGANGVIMITTKEGKEGAVKFTYNGFAGYQEGHKSEYFQTSINDHVALELANNEFVSDATRIKQLLGDTDWEDIVINGGYVTSHSLSARGGSQRTKYSTSLSYLHDEGVLLVDDFKKYNFKARVDTKVSDKFSLGFNINPSYTKRRRYTDALRQMVRQSAPWLPERHTARTLQFVNFEDFPDLQPGDYVWQSHFDDVTVQDVFFDDNGNIAGFNEFESGSISNTGNAGPLLRILERETFDERLKVYGNVKANYKINDDFSLKSNITVTFQDLLQTVYRGTESTNFAGDALARERNQSRLRFVENLFLNYSKDFADHEIDAVLGIAGEQEIDRTTEFEGNGFTNDDIPRIEGATNIFVREGYTRERRLISFIGRVNYAFKDRYLASISVRRDGSSIFGSNNKFGTFPAFSFGWRVSEEGFLSGSSIISNLKIRASYGVTGNDNVNLPIPVQEFYPYLPILRSEPTAVEGGTAQTFNPINIANDNLRWERSIEINPGIDFGLFDNRINGSIEYYRRTSDDLLLDVPISSVTGFTTSFLNIGEVRNEGIEVNFKTFNMNRSNFKWSTNFIASTNENTLTDFGDADGTVFTPSDGSDRNTEWIASVGNPISNFYGFVYESDVPLEYRARPFEIIGSKSQEVYVKDLNGDGIINDDDRTILGNAYPEFIWSITNEFTIGRFDVSFMFQGSHGAETRNIADLEGFSLSLGANATTAEAPRSEFLRPRVLTSDIIQDASFLALRNLNIGYTLPGNILEQFKIQSARVYASASNLLYFHADNFTGWNPESIRQGGDFTPITYGYNRGGSPIVRKVVLGVNINF